MVELFTARSGAPSLKVNGVALNSPYDPQREAERFVQETIGSERPSLVIVLGECVGHVVDALARHCPGVLLIAAVYSAEIAAAAELRGVSCWHPGSGLAFDEFLRSHLEELQIEGLRVVEWPPSARAFPQVSRSANEAVRQVIQELNGSFVTTVAAGRLWMRNCVANFVHVPKVLSGPLCPAGRPVLIAAPGPSLEEALPLLAGIRPRVELWALPSSCPALQEAGLEPDLIVMTDPGFYAMYHLYAAAPRCAVAMPLSAARGCWDLPTRPPVVLLEQPFLAERALLEAAGVTAPRVAPHGTVAATAIDLALASTPGPVILAGLDMAARDVLSHARPNEFDRLLQLQSGRFQPHTSLSFSRAAAFGSAAEPGTSLRQTPALRTYAGWLGTGLDRQTGRRLYRLLPSAVPIPAMTPLDAAAIHSLLSSLPSEPGRSALTGPGSYPTEPKRRRIASTVLAAWSKEVAAARAAMAAENGGSGTLPGRFPRAAELAYPIAPRRLMESLKENRLGNTEASRKAAVEALEETRRFLDSLAGKILG